MELESRPVGALRELAAAQGVHPTDDDLAAVQSFLEVILPTLAELEQRLPPELSPS